jgi:hypothetical protein
LKVPGVRFQVSGVRCEVKRKPVEENNDGTWNENRQKREPLKATL